MVHDLALTLWTAERKPEPRFVELASFSGHGAIQVPAESEIRFPLIVPLNAKFRTGMAVPVGGALRFRVLIGGQEIHAQTVETDGEMEWIEVDLTPWAGEHETVELVTSIVRDDMEMSSRETMGIWLMPQIEALHDWVAPYPSPELQSMAIGGRFEAPGAKGRVELVGLRPEPSGPRPGDQLDLTLFWHAPHRVDAYATVFVHLLDEEGRLVAQADSPPVSGTYPISVWRPNWIISDRHQLQLPADISPGRYHLAVGLYDPLSLRRWSGSTADGGPLLDNRIVLDLFVE
jgi:hypothetical protein